jgi:hypothetical protein
MKTTIDNANLAKMHIPYSMTTNDLVYDKATKKYSLDKTKKTTIDNANLAKMHFPISEIDYDDNNSLYTDESSLDKIKKQRSTTQILQKNARRQKKYVCEACEFITGNKYNYQQHCLTSKHHELTLSGLGQHMKEVCAPMRTYRCVCDKTFNDRAGLFRHKKKCGEKKEDYDLLVPLVMDVMKKNNELSSELLKQNQELQRQMLEICKNGINCHNVNTINSNNKFNLNMFLNETCKDALNISEFVDSVKISLSDIENVGSLGYVEGISKIIIKNLRELDITKRPIHCTDFKREIIHIKDNNEWEREDEDKTKIINSIKTIAHKNILSLSDWKEANPDYKVSDCKKSDVYMKIVNESMGACDKMEDEKNYNKIIQKIAKETTIKRDV